MEMQPLASGDYSTISEAFIFCILHYSQKSFLHSVFQES